MKIIILTLSVVITALLFTKSVFALQQMENGTYVNEAIFSNPCVVSPENTKKTLNKTTADRLYLRVDLHSCYQALLLKTNESYQSIDVNVLTKVDGDYKEGGLDFLAAKESLERVRTCQKESSNKNCFCFYVYFLNKIPAKNNEDFLIKLGYM